MAKKKTSKKKKAASRKPSKKRPAKKATAKKKSTKKAAKKKAAPKKKATKKAAKKKAARKKKAAGRPAPNTRGRDVNVKGPVECVGGRPVIRLGEGPAHKAPKRAAPTLRLSLLGEQAGVERDAALHRVRAMSGRAAVSQLQSEALDAARGALRAIKAGEQAPAERAAAKALGCAAAAAQLAPDGPVAQAAKSGNYPSALGALGRLAGVLKP